MPVHHDFDGHRFTHSMPSGTAFLAYSPAGPGLVELYSTFVPSADRGKGIAAGLVEAAVAYARQERLRIIPSCWYVAEWMQQHPEHADLLADT